MPLLDHLLGDPDRLSTSGLARGVRRGSEGFAVRCLRALGERPESPTAPLLAALARPEAGVRRAAARALGNLAPARPDTARMGCSPDVPPLVQALERAWDAERTEEGRAALAVARARWGDDARALAAALDHHDQRVLQTVGGPRSPAAVHGLGPPSERLWLALGGADDIRPRASLLAERRRAFEEPAPPQGRAGDHADRAQSLAILGHPDDLVRIEARFRSAGRRGEHALFLALGLSGDPRAAVPLRDALRAMDVDPGRGFAQRRIAATGLGRLGLRQGAAWLHRALQDEAADYEGRPGAGLGIQYPVRTNLLWALGEIADPASLPTLLAHLDDTSGSALGGFYLPAMDALVKLGPVAFPALRDTAARAPEVTAAHAVGVLAAGGDDVRRWAADPRRPVRELARRAG